MNPKRARLIAQGKNEGGSVLYWMSRDMRVQDNWAMVFADRLAKEQNKKLVVGYYFFDKKLYSQRVYDYFLAGIERVKEELKERGIEFRILNTDKLGDFSDIVFDFSPLAGHRKRLEKVKRKFDGNIWEVDAHNIVPCWVASEKLEFGAYTLRPKIKKLLPEFLDEYPNEWKSQNPDKAIVSFVNEREKIYSEKRNDPNEEATSRLSAELHFGHISAQRVALMCRDEAFLEELIVRRELADNFCYYQPNYDKFEGFWSWAQASLNEHRQDKREFVYRLQEFEDSVTHDKLWNAANNQMKKTGWMHGYMRMYWAKKILEWSQSPEEAIKIAIYLNDKYELDGRDANGYTGIAWSIGGVHDRAWFERPIFGKIRYMNYNGCKSKFNVEEYINTWL